VHGTRSRAGVGRSAEPERERVEGGTGSLMGREPGKLTGSMVGRAGGCNALSQ
jgi:hypothetical protein